MVDHSRQIQGVFDVLCLGVKDTWYLWDKNSENLVCNLANKPYFQNPTKNILANAP